MLLQRIFVFFPILCLPWSDYLQANVETKYFTSSEEVVIVGAGLAGLTTAYRLQQEGYTVKIFEARDRPGGRVYTVTMGDSYEELGGKALSDGGKAKHIIGLMEELGLAIDTIVLPYSHVAAKDSSWCNYLELFADIPEPDEIAFEELQMLATSHRNFDGVLTSFFGNNKLLYKIASRRMQSYEGSDPKDLSPFYIDSFFDFLKETKRFANEAAQGIPPIYVFTTTAGGNSRLVNALVNQLIHPIHYQSPLRKIQRSPEGTIALFFDHDLTIHASCVILAIPCSTLRDVVIEEGLFPVDQKHAIETLQYGTNAKILVSTKLSSLEFPEIISSDTMILWFNKPHTIMTLYYGGTEGLFHSSDAVEVERKFLESLPFINQASPSLQIMSPLVAMSWIHEEFSKGSYSNYGVDQFECFHQTIKIEDIPCLTAFRPIENKIFFAGEHTALEYPATMEGAVESGERTANIVKRKLPRLRY